MIRGAELPVVLSIGEAAAGAADGAGADLRSPSGVSRPQPGNHAKMARKIRKDARPTTHSLYVVASPDGSFEDLYLTQTTTAVALSEVPAASADSTVALAAPSAELAPNAR
jgi:hypothetical protein